MHPVDRNSNHTRHLSLAERDANAEADYHFQKGEEEANVNRDYSAAMLHYHMALKLQREAMGHDHPIVAMTLNSIGVALMKSGDTEVSERKHNMDVYPDRKRDTVQLTTIISHIVFFLLFHSQIQGGIGGS